MPDAPPPTAEDPGDALTDGALAAVDAVAQNIADLIRARPTPWQRASLGQAVSARLSGLAERFEDARDELLLEAREDGATLEELTAITGITLEATRLRLRRAEHRRDTTTKARGGRR